MRVVLASLTALVLLSTGGSVAQSFCDAPASGAFGIVEIGAGEAHATWYLDDRGFLLGSGAYLYEEANGVFTPHTPMSQSYADDNLQRGGASSIFPNQHDVCNDFHPAGPDQLLL